MAEDPAVAGPAAGAPPGPDTDLSRRRFLGVAGGLAGGLAVGAGAWAALLRDQVQDTTPGPRTSTGRTPGPATTAPRPVGRVLVVVQQAGGNDALNTVVPLGDGRYRDLRPRVALPEADLVHLVGNEQLAFHPSLAPLAPWWEAGRLGIVRGVGLEGQSRSHFSSMDTWWSATPGEPSATGWLGRWLDATGAGTNPLRGISLGDSCPALVGEQLQATFVHDPDTFRLLAPAGVDADQLTAAFLTAAQPLGGDPWLAASQQALPATAEAVDLLEAAVGERGGGLGLGEDTTPTATRLLETAAAIIDLQVGTEVVVVGVGGFDTHQGQAEPHARLLADVAGGITRFFELLDAQGRAADALVITTSEFGRRVQDNASSGTDHGTGGTLFVVGPGVRGAVVGDADLGDLVEGDLRIGVDSRSLYQLALTWLGGPTEEVLAGRYDDLGLLA